jgi:hypothetical protein
MKASDATSYQRVFKSSAATARSVCRLSSESAISATAFLDLLREFLARDSVSLSFDYVMY